MTFRSTITAGLVLAATSALLLTGCAGRATSATLEPAASATIKDTSCPWSLSQAKFYTTHPSKVKSTKTASCVLAYIRSVNPSNGLKTIVSLDYTVRDDHEYGDAGGDGVYTQSYQTTWDTRTKQGFELQHIYDELGDLDNSSGTDTVRVRYLDTAAGKAYTSTPTQGEGWSAASAGSAAPSFVFDKKNLFPSTGFVITSWKKSAAHLRNTWAFSLGTADAGGTITAVVASNGQVLSVTSSYHWDGQQHTTKTTFSAVYGTSVKYIQIPKAVVDAASAS
jgi:hypothetical protein